MLDEDRKVQAVRLQLANNGEKPLVFVIEMAPDYVGKGPARREVAVAPGKSSSVALALAATQGWYDFTVTSPGVEGFLRRFAGKVDNGAVGLTDPGIGTLRVTV